MAGKITLGNEYGYRYAFQLSLPLAPTLAVKTLTPADSELHDITKEGILVSHISMKVLASPATTSIHFGLFNRTSNNNPKTNYDTAAYKDNYAAVATGASYALTDFQRNLDLTSLPGGGVPMIADFITFAAIFDSAMASNGNIEVALYYRWITINPDAYRSILYARSV